MWQLPFLVHLSSLSGLVPLGAGIYLWNRSTRPMRLLTGLLLFNLLNNVALVLAALRWGNNMFLVHLHTLISYLLIALLFSYWHTIRPAGIIRLSIPLFFIIYVILFTLGYEELQLPNKYSLSIQGVLVAFIALYTLYATLQDQSDLPAYRNERFWVSFGAFINYPGNVLVYAAIPVFITHPLWQIHSVLSILGNILYFGAYLCLRK